MKKRLISLFMVGVMSLSLMACTTKNETPSTTSSEDTQATQEAQVTETAEESIIPAPTKDEAPLHMAFVPASMNTYYSLVLDGLNEQIDRYGGKDAATVDVYAPTSETKLVEEQIGFLETLLQEDDLDVLYFSTHNDEAFIPYLKQFCEKGVKVFLFNMPEQDVKNEYYVSLISYDFKQAGFECGEWVVNHFGDQEVKMLYLEGIEGTHNTVRMEGFKEAISGHDNIQIVVSQSADWSREGGQRVTENALQSNPEINCVFGPYDEMPLGAIVALKDAQRLSDVTVVGYDLTEDGYNAIKKGEMAASVNTSPKQMGNNMVDAAVQYCLEGKQVEKKIFNDLLVYDSSNIADVPADNYGYTERAKELEITK